jgi:hypothetical protein
MRVAMFLVIGPIIGGVVFILVAPFVGGELKIGLMAGYATLLISLAAFPFFLVGCYMLGWKAALATGLIVGVIGPRIQSRYILLATAATVGAVAAAALGTDGPEKKVQIIFLCAFVGAASSTTCTWFLHRIDLMRPRESPLA